MVKVDFNVSDFGEFSKADIKSALVGRIATCKECCSERVVISRSCGPQGVIWAVSCGTPGCTHNIAGLDLPEVVNRWNTELAEEGDEDYATEVVVFFI